VEILAVEAENQLRTNRKRTVDQERIVSGSRILSVNVGLPRTVTWAGRVVTSAIWKAPMSGRVPVAGVNFEGDDQADRRVHGGTDKAVYAYAAEDYAWWSAELGTEIGIATFGDNLTTEGIDLNACVVGTRWHVGSAVLEVAQPRQPCFKLGMRMGDAHFVDRFDDARRSGAYLRIIEHGEVGAGDEIRVGEPPAHGFAIADFIDVRHDPSRASLQRVVSVADIPVDWRDWAARQLERHYNGGQE
jgi:MOSC domain-containing protein YiiM